MKTFILTLISSFVVANLFVWWRGAAALRRARASKWMRRGFGWLVFLQIALILFVLFGRMNRLEIDEILPTPVQVVFFIWHPLVLVIAVIWLVCSILYLLRQIFRRPEKELLIRSLPLLDAPRFTRREFFSYMAALTPPVLAFGVSGIANAQLSEFRVRRLTVPLPQLPDALNGMTVVHLTDTHVGRFTHGEVLKRIADTVKQLNADLVCFTGDLINDSLRWFPEARAMLERIGSPVYLCEGNHDLIDSRMEFHAEITNVPNVVFLHDSATTVRVRGLPVQILGVGWSRQDDPERTRRLMQQRDPSAFGILLTHHPHVWDHTHEVPLTLAGHTHGGQLMLTKEIGFGPQMYRYWTGLYTRTTGAAPKQALVVSNGAGNWYPIRTNAPAEIIHLTLVKG